MRKLILGLVIFLAIISSFGQNNQIDSLRSVVETSPEDTSKVNTLITLANRLVMSDPDETIRYSTQAKELAEKLGYKKGLGYALKSIGMGHYFQAEYLEVLIYWQQSLNTFDSIGEKAGIANMSSNLGSVHFSQGDDTKAIDYYLKSLKVSEEVGDKLRIATALQNIGAVYSNKEQTYDLALQYYHRALPMSIELDDHEAIGTVAVNMGEIFLLTEVYDSALYFFNISLEAYKRSESLKVAYTMTNIGKVYSELGKYGEAIDFQKEAYNIAKTREARLEMTQSLRGLAETYVKQGNYPEAIKTYKLVEQLSTEIGSDYELKFSYEGLAKSYEQVKDYSNAFKYQKLFTVIKDTLYNAEMDKKLQLLNLNLDLEKKQSNIEL
jgi:tetratricopeptide (TPR) repeat protein